MVVALKLVMCVIRNSVKRVTLEYIIAYILVNDLFCVVCSKAFSDMSNLTTHQLTHGGEWPFNCDVCNKGFRQKGHLTKHLCIHTC
jgi:uncharacterized Zn-finger protein